MTTSSYRRLGSPLAALLALAMVALLSGCESAAPPLSQDTAVADQTTEGPVYLVFSPQAAQGVAKIATIPPEGRSVIKLVKPSKSKRLKVRDEGDDDEDALKVVLAIDKHAVVEPVQVTMTVYGNTLSELVAAFEPGGLTFLAPAMLKIDLGGERIDIPYSEITAYHVQADGSVEEAGIVSVRIWGDDDDDDIERIVIKVAVPGFSRYCLSKGSIPCGF